MASPSKNTLRPWHTRSFFAARFLLLLAGFFCFAFGEHTSVICGVFGAVAFVDGQTLWAWQKKQVALPAPHLDGALLCQQEEKAFGNVVYGFAAAFVAVAAALWFLPSLNDGENLWLRYLIVALTNGAGWFFVAWVKETAPLREQYAAMHQKRSPMLSHLLPMQPVAQPQTVAAPKPQAVRAGAGG